MEEFVGLAIGIGFALFYVAGLRHGMKLSKGEKIVEIKNPIKEIKNHIEKEKTNKVIEKKIEKINTVMDNIENYDGTPEGQKEV